MCLLAVNWQEVNNSQASAECEDHHFKLQNRTIKNDIKQHVLFSLKNKALVLYKFGFKLYMRCDIADFSSAILDFMLGNTFQKTF